MSPRQDHKQRSKNVFNGIWHHRLVGGALIVYLIRRDHLNVRYGIWWIGVAVAFIVLGFYPRFFDWLAAQLGMAYGPVLALTLGLTVFAIKLLTLDIARSRSETKIVRLVQRISMLEAQIEEHAASRSSAHRRRSEAGRGDDPDCGVDGGTADESGAMQVLIYLLCLFLPWLMGALLLRWASPFPAPCGSHQPAGRLWFFIRHARRVPAALADGGCFG